MATAVHHEPSLAGGSPCEVSVVIPCLNEAETIVACVERAIDTLSRAGITGEVVVADNGSSDDSVALARRAGARVVEVAERGYGNALRGGIESAGGRFVIMGDGDGSYDFAAIPAFVERLRQGFDLVMGNRFAGGILPGAMPWKNRWLGNPALSGLGRFLFGITIGDFHCGLRGLSAAAYRRIALRTTGMEFASEMVIKAHLHGLKITEVPATLSPDGRSRAPHLRPWRDGWRHLRFMLLFSPRWLFLIPGLVLTSIGAVTTGALVRGPLRIGGLVLDIHTLLVAAFLCVLGYQLVIFAVFARVYAGAEGFYPPQRLLSSASRFLSLEVGVALGAGSFLAGAILAVVAVAEWRATGFAGLDPAVTMRRLIPAVLLMILGAQTVFSSFFVSILTLAKRGPSEPVAGARE